MTDQTGEAMRLQVTAVIFRCRVDDIDYWIMQCLEYDIAVQSQTIDDVVESFHRTIEARLAIAPALNMKSAFGGIHEAPARCWELFNRTKTVVACASPYVREARIAP